MDKVQKNYERWLASDKVSAKDKDVLRAMDAKERDDAFFQDIEFGTAGMRGVLGPGTNRMNEHTVRKATVAFALYLLEKFPDARERGVAISHDNRHLSREFTLESASILNDMGINAFIFDGLRPTPELSYAVREQGCVGGIMITASHNPRQYNGYKVYDETGCQLVPRKIKRLLEIISELPDELACDVKKDAHAGKTVTFGPEMDDKYVALVEAIQIHPELDKKGFPVVYTPQHGASYENAMRVFQDLGYEILPVVAQCVHDPDFGATLSPNPELEEAYVEPLKLAKEHKAPLIVMTDPDGDRCGVAYLASDGTYQRFTGNQSAALLLDYILRGYEEKGALPKDGVVYDTIVSSSLARKVAESHGVSVESFLTGFKYIGDRIHHYERLGGPTFLFGYEESYGCLVKPFVRDKDGLQAILLYVEMALYHYRAGTPLDIAYRELEKRVGFVSSTTESVYFEGSEGASAMKAIMEKLHENAPSEVLGRKVVRVEDYLKGEILDLATGEKKPTGMDRSDVVRLLLEDTSWIAVRPSGTEPKCKFYVEAAGTKEEGLDEEAKALVSSIKGILGVKA